MTRNEAARWLARRLVNYWDARQDQNEVAQALLDLTVTRDDFISATEGYGPREEQDRSRGSAWLIERGQAEAHHPTVWWCGPGPHDYTEDAQRAVRFGERGEAQRTLETQGFHFVDSARVVEHVFVPPTCQPQPPKAEGWTRETLAKAMHDGTDSVNGWHEMGDGYKDHLRQQADIALSRPPVSEAVRERAIARAHDAIKAALEGR